MHKETGMEITLQPVNPGPNCTFNLTAGQEIISSSCDTDDEIYEENCEVTIKCKNGTYPMTNKGTRSQLCEKGEWVDPVTKGPLQPYPCNDSCKDISAVTKNPRNTSQPFGNTTVTCSRGFIRCSRIPYLQRYLPWSRKCTSTSATRQTSARSIRLLR